MTSKGDDVIGFSVHWIRVSPPSSPYSRYTMSVSMPIQITKEVAYPLLIAVKAAVLDTPQWQDPGGWWEKDGELYLSTLSKHVSYIYN